MSEEELNKKWLKDELKEFSYSNEFFDKILDLLSKQYINGLEQSRFEKNLLEQENKKLKKQLEDIKNEPLTNRIGRIDSIVANIYSRNRTQQKEFIEWLEKEIQRQEDYAVSLGLTIDYDIAEYTSGKIDALKESLSKYKEIIGVKDE